MSLKYLDHLPIRRIAKLWAAEANRPDDAVDIEDDLIEAALQGEFQFRFKPEEIRHKDGSLPPNYEPRVGFLIEIFGKDGEPRASWDLKQYVQGTIEMGDLYRPSPDAPLQSTRSAQQVRASRRQELAQTICISTDGLRRWVDRDEFSDWAALRGLKRPSFVAGETRHSVKTERPNVETRREERKRKTEEKYQRWHTLALEIRKEDKSAGPTDIARRVEKRELKRLKQEGVKEKGVNAANIKRRLDEFYPGWSA